MFLNLIYTELIKYKRTPVFWMIAIGGVLTAGTAMLLVTSEKAVATWDGFTVAGMNGINLVALFIVAVMTGYVISGEYQQSTIGILFTYPVSKIKLFMSKQAVMLIFCISLYISFLVSAFLFGIVFIGIPEWKLILKLLRLIFIMAGLNFVLVPLTSLICLLVKSAGTSIFTGMGYFISYMCFINMKNSLFILTCTPNKLVDNYFVTESIGRGDVKGILAVSAAVFVTSALISAVYYSRHDVYK
ncbi:ABC transporter permease [Ruminiclostridium cellulolyticum]|uniref:Uncharacterized protein n=1 Tax=Ruminiclostridium cellulolyticum (strain ATCC 35319 / DSM 5812 / JCM 6584 / H10) TaxID=394503 RepID=B8I017_RUMCH|nr:ABC transporter permease [Ruminiclostridium cellulolyticum]ACL75517.1 hypothetical protein Ccel_1160 [Ruminiclostridium cellulolyticum H10]